MCDICLVSVAEAFKVHAGNIEYCRLVCCAVLCTPRRVTNVENAIKGHAKNSETAESVGEMATEGARELAHNGFKVPLMQNLVKRAISA